MGYVWTCHRLPTIHGRRLLPPNHAPSEGVPITLAILLRLRMSVSDILVCKKQLRA